MYVLLYNVCYQDILTPVKKKITEKTSFWIFYSVGIMAGRKGGD
jgi:hypothetical protein